MGVFFETVLRFSGSSRSLTLSATAAVMDSMISLKHISFKLLAFGWVDVTGKYV